jgi:chromosome segregation ATPase
MEKNRFKAGTYMTEINQREEELGRIRAQLMNNQDEMKLLTVTREQFRQQKEQLAEKLKDRDSEIDKLNRRLIEMNRLVDSMCVAQRSVANNAEAPENQAAALDKARDDIERADRIARSTTKSSFMNLGDKQPKLLSEDIQAKNYGTGGPKTLSNVEGNSKTGLDDAYLRDDSLPPEIFNIIQSYREKIMKLTKGS